MQAVFAVGAFNEIEFLAVALSLLLLGHIIGVGIGTAICVFAIGNICQFVDDHFGHLYRKVYNSLGIVD